VLRPVCRTEDSSQDQILQQTFFSDTEEEAKLHNLM